MTAPAGRWSRGQVHNRSVPPAVQIEDLDELEAVADLLADGGWRLERHAASLAADDPARRVRCDRGRGRGRLELQACVAWWRGGDPVCCGRRDEGPCRVGRERSWELACIQGEICGPVGWSDEGKGEGNDCDGEVTEMSESSAAAIRDGDGTMITTENRLCQCGCGQPVRPISGAKYASIECRRRYWNEEALRRYRAKQQQRLEQDEGGGEEEIQGEIQESRCGEPEQVPCPPARGEGEGEGGGQGEGEDLAETRQDLRQLLACPVADPIAEIDPDAAALADAAALRMAVRALWHGLGYSDPDPTPEMLLGEAERLEREKTCPTWGIADEAAAAAREREDALRAQVAELAQRSNGCAGSTPSERPMAGSASATCRSS